MQFLFKTASFFVQLFLKAAPIHKSLDDFIIYDRVVYCIMTNSQRMDSHDLNLGKFVVRVRVRRTIIHISETAVRIRVIVPDRRTQRRVEFSVFCPCYTIGRTMSTFKPSASIMRKNIPTPGSITPFSMREI